MRILDGYYLIAWLFDDGMQAYALAESVDFAKQVARERLTIEPKWEDPVEGGVIHIARLNIPHDKLPMKVRAVMIQPVPLYTIAKDKGTNSEQQT